MLLQSMPSIVQTPLIPLLVLFGVGLGVGVAVSLLGALGTTDVPSPDDLADDTRGESSDVRRDGGDVDR